jgi:hypothetical protein
LTDEDSQSLVSLRYDRASGKVTITTIAATPQRLVSLTSMPSDPTVLYASSLNATVVGSEGTDVWRVQLNAAAPATSTTFTWLEFHGHLREKLSPRNIIYDGHLDRFALISQLGRVGRWKEAAELGNQG